MFMLRGGQRILDMTKIIILANFLKPGDFGLMGIALLVCSSIKTLSQTGFQEALVQKKEDIKKYLNTVWTVFVLRGIILFIILFLLSYYVEIFFNAAGAKNIIRIIGLSIVFHSLTNIGVIYFHKELEFNKQFVFQLSGTVVDFIISIVLCFVFKNVWALVFGLLAGNFMRLIMSYIVHPYRPHLCIDLLKIKELFGFGKWILGSSILVFLLTQGDDILVGKLLGASALGFYQMAYRISNLPATEISHLISTVTLPAYSKLQDNLPKMKDAYLRVLRITALFSLPISGLIFILAPEFARIFLGQKWMPMVSTIQILSIYGLLRAFGATTGVVFIAVGKPKIRTKIQAAQLGLMAAIIYPLTVLWGINGAAAAVTIYALIFNCVAVLKVLDIVESDFRNPAKIIIFPLIGTLFLVCSIFGLKTYLLQRIGVIQFFFLIISGIMTYAFVMYLADSFFSYGNKKLVKDEIKKFFRS